MGQGGGQPPLGGHRGRQGVQGLDNDKHVVDADAEEEEGQDGVGHAVREPDHGADAVTELDLSLVFTNVDIYVIM